MQSLLLEPPKLSPNPLPSTSAVYYHIIFMVIELIIFQNYARETLESFNVKRELLSSAVSGRQSA